MKTDRTPEPRRMDAGEQKEFINLMGIISQMAHLEDGIGRRIAAIPRGRFRLRGAMSSLVRLANDLTRSMPGEQREHMRRQLPAIRMIVGTTAQLPRSCDSTYGRWLSFKELDAVASAIRECCRTCAISDPARQRQCMYCRLLDSLPTDKPDEFATGCGYFTIW